MSPVLQIPKSSFGRFGSWVVCFYYALPGGGRLSYVNGLCMFTADDDNPSSGLFYLLVSFMLNFPLFNLGNSFIFLLYQTKSVSWRLVKEGRPPSFFGRVKESGRHKKGHTGGTILVYAHLLGEGFFFGGRIGEPDQGGEDG